MPLPQRIIRLKETERKSGLKRDSIYRLARAGKFPRPIKISERATGWIEAEVDEFIAERMASRDVSTAPSGPTT